MKRIHYLLLGLLVSLTIAAVSPTVPPTRLTAGGNITIVTNSLNNFTLSGSVTNYDQNFTNVIIYGSGTNALLIPGTNRVGIQTTTTVLAPLHVGNYNQNYSVDAQILISRRVNDVVAGNGHGFSDSSYVTRTNNIGYNSYDARILLGGTTTFDHYAGFQSAPSIAMTSGTMANYYGLYDANINFSSGTLTNDYGFYKATSAGAGTLQKIYGIYIESQTKGTVTNFAIYTAGTTPSYFGGALYATNTNSLLGGFDAAIRYTNTIIARKVNGNIRMIGGSTDATDGALFVSPGADIYLSNWNADRGWKIASAGDISTLGTGKLVIGASGTGISKVLSASAALNFNLTLVDVEDLTITVTGAEDGDTVSLGVPNGSVTTSVQYTGWVSAANTVTIRARTSAAGEDPASGTFRATVTKF